MSQQELLALVIARLRNLGIEFMLTGSHASSLQGEPRSTHDIDLVAKLAPEHVRPLVLAFTERRFHLSESAVAEAVQSKRMFNLLETSTGESVDFWVLTDTPFDQARFARRQRFDADGQSVDVSSPEDTILMKLCWCKLAGGSQKQWHDALRVHEMQADLLDVDYMQRWVSELELQDLWRRLLDEAEPIRLDD